MSNQIVISSGAKVRNLDGVLTGSTGVVGSVPLGAANGVATLDSGGKVPVSQLPSSVVTYLGTWDAATNTPTLTNGTGDAGDMYICNVAGTVNFGAGPITFAVGDWVLYGSGTWQKSNGQNGTVTSVAVTESGDALSITGSPITTAGTINIGFAGTGSQYIKGDGTLATFPSIITEAQTLVTEVYNSTGATLTKGTIVYINGGQGNLPTVTKAIATSDATSAQTYGVVKSDITNNNNGYVIVIGSLGDLDTQAYSNGTQLYLSGTTEGAWTSTKPSAPIHLVYVGIVVRSHPTQGVVEVKIQNGYELDELHDVAITSVANNDGIFYNSSNDLWENKTIAEVLGYTPQAQLTLTTTGTSGAATLVGSTLNIPQYTDAYTGTVTSVAMTVPTGLSVSGSPITTSGTLAVSLASGYSIPTTAKQSNWDAAYDLRITSVAGPLTFESNALGITQANTTTNGYLTSTDWNTFNNKQSALTNPVTGTGTTNYLPKFTGTTTIGDSAITDDGTTVTLISRALSGSKAFFDAPLILNEVALEAKWEGVGGFIAKLINTSTQPYATYLFYNGYVGIGGTPENKLQIGSVGTTGYGGNDFAIGNGTNVFAIYQSNNSTNFYASKPYSFQTSNVLINTTTDAGYKLDVNGTGRFSGALSAKSATITETTSNTYGSIAVVGNSRGGSVDFYANSTSVGGIYADSSANLYLYSGNSFANRLTIASTGAATFSSTIQATSIIRTVSAGGGLISTELQSDGVYSVNTSLYLYAPASRDISLWAGATEKMRITSGGNVGIGTTSPSALIETYLATSTNVNTPATSGTTPNNALARFNNVRGQVLDIGSQYSGDYGIWMQVSDKGNLGVNYPLLLQPNGGNVGIGTSSPSDKLEIYNGTYHKIKTFFDGSYTSGFKFSDYYGGIKYDAGNDRLTLFANYPGDAEITFDTVSTERMRITSSGIVQIGAAVSGGGTLQVNGNVNINGVFQINGTTIGGGGGSGITGSGTTNYIPKWSGSTSLGNSIMYETASGIGYNTTSPSYTLDVNGSFGFRNTGYIFDSILYSYNSSTGTYFGFANNSTGGRLFMSDNSTPMQLQAGGGNVLIGTTTNNGYKINLNGSISFAYGYTSVFRGSSGANDILVGNTGSTFYVGGSVSATGGFFDTSDSRLKTLITDNHKAKGIENVTAKLYIKNGKEELGYYAQDLQEILPSAIVEGADGFLTLSYSQVHTAKIAQLEAEVAELKELIKKLL